MMYQIFAPIGRHLSQFHAEEGGSSTIEFALFVPFFLVFFISSFEMGMLMVRHTMLDRGVDLAVREIRLGHFIRESDGVDLLSRETLRTAICDYAAMIPECTTRLRIEMLRVDPHDWSQNLTPNGDCVNVTEAVDPVGPFSSISTNDLMVIRVCALFEPYALTAGLGAGLHKRSGDLYALFTTSAFVVEPRLQ